MFHDQGILTDFIPNGVDVINQVFLGQMVGNKKLHKQPHDLAMGLLISNERQKLMKLRKQLKRVEMERDILAKATTWFANNKD